MARHGCSPSAWEKIQQRKSTGTGRTHFADHTRNYYSQNCFMTDLHRINQLEHRMDNIDKKLDDIRELLTRMQVAAAKIQHCPAPGTCLSIGPRVDRLEGRMDALHNTLEQLKGAWMGGKAVAGLIWALVGSAVTLAIAQWVTR